MSHLYNLRGTARYRKLATKWEPTRPTATLIGERRQPDPRGQPGYLRIDTVHQGDWNGVKGVYHINAVDAVTQWQIVGCVGRISEQHLLPVLEAILHQFPFRILGFHCAFRRRRTAFRREAEQDSGPVPNNSRSVAALAF